MRLKSLDHEWILKRLVFLLVALFGIMFIFRGTIVESVLNVFFITGALFGQFYALWYVLWGKSR